MAKPSYFSLPPQILTQYFFCREFSASAVRIIFMVGGMGNFYTLYIFGYDLNTEYHNKMAPLRFAIIHVTYFMD